MTKPLLVNDKVITIVNQEEESVTNNDNGTVVGAGTGAGSAKQLDLPAIKLMHSQQQALTTTTGNDNDNISYNRNHNYSDGRSNMNQSEDIINNSAHRTLTSFTEETSSVGAYSSSARSSDNGQAYEVIEYDNDFDANVANIKNALGLDIETDDTSEIFAEVVGKTAVINIDDDSPAAEALRANAKIHVSSVGKAARAVQLQSVRRVLKRAIGTTKSGYRKGKPPRIPPTLIQQQSIRNNFLGGGGPIDVDSYMDQHEFKEHTNYQDILMEGTNEDDNDDDDDGDGDNYNDKAESVNDGEMDRHDVSESSKNDYTISGSNGGIAPPLPPPPPILGVIDPSLHQYGIDEPSFSEIGGEDDITASTKLPTTTTSMHPAEIVPATEELARITNEASVITSHQQQQQQQHPNEKILDREMMHIPDGVAPGTVEAGKKVLRSVDPYDLLRAVRWKRKKTGQLKKEKSYVKGKVIDGEHELYTLSIAVMIGVRTSISRTNTELNSLKPPLKRWVNALDFRRTEKYEFHPKGGDGPLLPPHQLAHTFKFKDYCPLVFAYLRRMYGVNEFDFLLSVCGNANFIEFISNAKSGQFFFYSSDGRYMIKTMTNAESKFLRQMLPEYFKHCCENPNTLVTRFFGMYRVKLYHLRRNVKFVIMNSVYYTDKNLHTFYDLKGSSIGRDAKPGQAVLKDNDLRRSLPDNAFVLRPQQRTLMRKQLESDCAFLTKMGVMDYSMLVGVHYVPPFEGRTSLTYRKGGGANASRGLTGLRIRRNTGGTSTQHGYMDDSEGTSNEGEPNMTQHQITSQCYSPVPDPPASMDISAPFNPALSPPRPPNVSYSSRARSEDKILTASPSTLHPTRSPLRPHSVANNSRARSDTWGMSALVEDGLEDDDCSYLIGSANRPTCNIAKVNEETERKKLATVEKLFWPFHHLYDIHGHRRLHPVKCDKCLSAPCSCDDGNMKALLAGYNIPKFVPPITDRKDGGLEMDTTGLQLPCTLKGGAPNGDLLYDGKIFYVGVIDILQEYNTRKEIESVYRMIQSSSKMAASCVPPQSYGRRFLEFFDQYTERPKRFDLAEQGQEVSFRV